MTEKILELNREKYIFWTLVSILFLAVAFYMFCINITVRNVVARQNIEQQSSQLTLNISNAEFKYITMNNTVTLQLAYTKGFKDVVNKVFISRSTANSVSLLTH